MFGRWEEVGEVAELVIFPLKSGCGVKVSQAEATPYGLAQGLLQDRSVAQAERGCGIFYIALKEHLILYQSPPTD